MESRVEEAVALFQEGYNCAQSVFGAYADVFGMDKETALKLISPMGAGIGRMRQVCGTVSGMALLSGLKDGNMDPKDREAKARTYEIVRNMSDEFEKENGSILCRELLGILSREESAMPAERTEEYYKVRPCVKLVRSAAQIVERQLLQEK
ncbi:MAG: C_GCAxxG_C_C family protein [Lachnospiraceae bacterium]|nr:C_GCAxxG_C_C family protein [Lachnospiraceae bacterium]